LARGVRSRGIMLAKSAPWLDYDLGAFVALVIGISAVSLLAVSGL
jgi:hypothetical protein